MLPSLFQYTRVNDLLQQYKQSEYSDILEKNANLDLTTSFAHTND